MPEKSEELIMAIEDEAELLLSCARNLERRMAEGEEIGSEAILSLTKRIKAQAESLQIIAAGLRDTISPSS